MTKTLLLPVGLPRSGKSTYCQQLRRSGDWVIVSPDAIRLALYGKPFIASADTMVWSMAKYMVKALFIAGHDSIILDACNLTEHRRKEWLSDDWKTVLHLVPTDADECARRAVSEGRMDLLPVIDLFDRMGQQNPTFDAHDWEYL
jgi:predicted kinase